jgi:non-ribosomal peptide synthetase component F
MESTRVGQVRGHAGSCLRLCRAAAEGKSMLTVELVRRGAARHKGRTAVRFGDQSLTFAEVDEAANRIAHVLAGLGAAKGARVGFLIDNGIWSIPADFGGGRGWFSITARPRRRWPSRR